MPSGWCWPNKPYLPGSAPQASPAVWENLVCERHKTIANLHSRLCLGPSMNSVLQECSLPLLVCLSTPCHPALAPGSPPAPHKLVPLAPYGTEFKPEGSWAPPQASFLGASSALEGSWHLLVGRGGQREKPDSHVSVGVSSLCLR